MMVAVLTNGHQNTTIYDKTELTCIEKLRSYIFLCIIFALMHLLNLTWIRPVLWGTQGCRTRPSYQFCITLLPLLLILDFKISTFV